MLIQTIILEDNRIIFKSDIRTSYMPVDHLVSIKDVKGGRYTSFKTKNRSVLVPSRIKHWDELVEILKSANPEIEIRRCSKIGKFVSLSVKILIVVLLLVGFFWISDPPMFGDRERAVNAIHKYHELYGRYPRDFQQLISDMPDAKIKYRYSYLHNDNMFIVHYSGGLIDNAWYYRSDTKEWIYLSYQPKDPCFQEYEEIVKKLRTPQ